MLPPFYCTRNILRVLHTINPATGNLQNSSTSKFPKNDKLKKSRIDFFNRHISKMLKLPTSFSVVIFLQQEKFINFIHIQSTVSGEQVKMSLGFILQSQTVISGVHTPMPTCLCKLPIVLMHSC